MGRLFRAAHRRGQWEKVLGYRSCVSPASLPVGVVTCGIIFCISLVSYSHFSVRLGGHETKQMEWAVGGSVSSRHLLAAATTNATNYDESCKKIENFTASTHGVAWERCDWEESFVGAKAGFVTMYIVITLIIFIALAIVCDDFFVPSLEAISEKLKLSEDVAGATFMAAGSSAPELFSSIAAVTFQSDVGVGTIMGSAVFNLLVIISLTAAFAGQVLHLDWRPLTRDSVFYALSIIFFIYSVWDTFFQWWEALVMLLLYASYILMMVFNEKLMEKLQQLQNKCCCSGAVKPADGDPEMALSDSKEQDSAPNGDVHPDRRNSLKSGNNPPAPNVFRHDRRNSVIHNLATTGSSRSSLRGDEPIYRKRSSVMQSVVNMKTLREDEDEMDKNGSPIREDEREDFHDTRGASNGKDLDVSSKKGDEDEEEEDDDPRIECCKGCPCPIRGAPPERPVFDEDTSGSKKCSSCFIYVLKWLIFIFAFPFICLFSWTIPECSKEHNRKYFLFSFIMSVLWIAALSFGMVTAVARMGCLLMVDPFVMSLVVLAAGTSIPDLLSSIIVARDGFGDMAVSNAIGSNVFDIDLGLGLPFLIRMIAELGKPFSVFTQKERNAYCENKMILMPHAKFGFILLGLLILAKFVFIITRYKLSKAIGVTFFLTYIAFLVYAFLQEFMCSKEGMSYNC